MATYSAPGVFVTSLGPTGGGSADAWKLSRCAGGVVPAMDAAPPSGSADAGPIVTGTTYGGPGSFVLACPTNEDYAIRVVYGGHSYWSLYPSVRFRDGTSGSVSAIDGAHYEVGSAVYNVKAPVFGATGNGVTDDTVAVRAAVNACNIAGGGTVFFPQGIYVVSASVSVGQGIILQGVGESSVIQPATGVAPAIFVLTGNGSGVQDLLLEGASSTYTSNPAADGIQIASSTQRTSVRRVHFYYLNGWCVSSTSPIDIWLEDLYGRQGKAGISLKGQSSIDANSLGAWINGCFMDTMQNGEGLLLTDAHDTFVNQFVCATSGAPAIHVVGVCAAVSITDSDVNAGGAVVAPAIQFDSNVNGIPSDISVTGGLYGVGSNDGSLINAGTNIGFTNVTFAGNTTNDIGAVTTGIVDFDRCRALSGFNNYAASATHIQGGTVVGGYGSFGVNIPGRGFHNVSGINPFGLTAPGVPGSGSPVAAAAIDRTFYVTTVAGTTSCSMAIQNGPTITCLASTAHVYTVRVPAGKTLTPTYTGTAPTWVVEGE